jgi:hypothetical protein
VPGFDKPEFRGEILAELDPPAGGTRAIPLRECVIRVNGIPIVGTFMHQTDTPGSA